jgi:muramoyltetrapeptide carboxypeptidase
LILQKFNQQPKWIVGYSDITVFHSHVPRHFGIATLHATMPLNFPKDGIDNQAINTLKQCLFGSIPNYEIDHHPFNRDGSAEGELVGGNLSMLYSLMASPSDIETEGKILFIEDLDEYLYHIDRMMMNLKRSGKLHKLAGLLVGGMSDMNDNTIPFGKTAEEIVRDTVAEYGFPVAFGFPAGHIKDNRALIIGGKVKFTVAGSSKILFI